MSSPGSRTSERAPVTLGGGEEAHGWAPAAGSAAHNLGHVTDPPDPGHVGVDAADEVVRRPDLGAVSVAIEHEAGAGLGNRVLVAGGVLEVDHGGILAHPGKRRLALVKPSLVDDRR